MVPLADFATWHFTSGPVLVMRYNMYPSAAINADAAAGHQFRPGHRAPDGGGQEGPAARRCGPSGPSWRSCSSRPATRPCASSCWPWCWCSWCWRRSTRAGRCRWPSSSSCRCACCAPSPAWSWRKMDINIFTQIGFVVLVGLACKNAILIVEFAKAQREEGADRAAGDAGGVPAAAAADHDDVVRVHPRRGAAGAVGGGRGGDAADAGHGGVRRHAGRDAVRHLPDAGVLSTSSSGSPTAGAGRPARRRWTGSTTRRRTPSCRGTAAMETAGFWPRDQGEVPRAKNKAGPSLP